MSRINTNIASLQAIHQLNANNVGLNEHLKRLSTGLRINAGKDAPAALIASENLRSEMTGVRQAIENSSRAGNVINTAEGALNEVSSLLLELQSLMNEAANSGGLSPEEISANQLQVDAILASVNRIANTTEFNGVKLLNGERDYTVSGVSTSAVEQLEVYAAKLPSDGALTVTVDVLTSARTGELTYSGATLGGSSTSIEIAGNEGVEQLSFAASTTIADVAIAVNSLTEATGVSAAVSGATLRLNSVEYGTDQFVSVNTLQGSFVNGKAFGDNAQVNVNGSQAEARGKTAIVRTSTLDLSLDLTADFATNIPGSTSFDITGGGALFQLGSTVNRQGQIHIAINSVSATKLGDTVNGALGTIASGGNNSLNSGNLVRAQKVLDRSIRQVAELRGRLGAVQRNVLETNIRSLQVALENVTASESAIRDADFAQESAGLTRAQILVQANTSVLAQANATPSSVLSLLQ